ncbi:MAG: Mfa1 fimbrilin C-terminal domain-containing protein, partial [Bacteroides sp.]|nr:Mfa1 fimbrilin C-terminal domain-containing protein [Bacteroides sp.]
DKGGYGRYGVVRNNYYCINLLKITGPGSVDIPDPEGPDDKEDGYLSTDIQVQDWYIRDQDVEEV